MISALYPGVVVHQRLRPVRHWLRYHIFYLFIDLDELPELACRLWAFSLNRFNLAAFYESDHGAGTAGGLRAWVNAQLAAASLPVGGPVRLLCMPRLLGQVFNPISVYFCYAPTGDFIATLYEVRNTFGQKHSYLITANAHDQSIDQSCNKVFYVSPFMDMDLQYRFRTSAPATQARLAITAADAQGVLIATSFAGKRVEISNAALLRRFLTMPLQAAKVLGAIHWEALRIWLKGVRLRPRPAAPAQPVSFIHQGHS